MRTLTPSCSLQFQLFIDKKIINRFVPFIFLDDGEMADLDLLCCQPYHSLGITAHTSHCFCSVFHAYHSNSCYVSWVYFVDFFESALDYGHFYATSGNLMNSLTNETFKVYKRSEAFIPILKFSGIYYWHRVSEMPTFTSLI